MSRENVDERGRRLLVEGRLRILFVDAKATDRIVAECRGDSGEVYKLGYDQQRAEWRCTCPARSRCAHLVALQLVTVKRGGGAA